MDDLKPGWDDLMARLEREREELALKMHLGRKDLTAEWERLEAQWRELKRVKGPAVKEAVSQTSSRIADELKRGYENIRKLL